MTAYRSNGGLSGNAYDRWVEQRSSESEDKSPMTKMQHHYWVTKQTVFRKLGKKDDECVVASDAELDAKLQLFRSIQESCFDLQRIIDKYQERLCSLAQEENSMGRFLKEAGKNDRTRAGKMMTAVGKSLSYSGQQRLALRVPLLRLYQEVETFRHRAIDDTLQNVNTMEKVRTEYRASLSWMKNVSQQLDPDTFKQLERFRKVQGQVRRSKSHFDQLKLDCLQKVDLLAAARCNMFSHALILYQNALVQFAEKTTKTFTTIANSFKGYQHYEFSVVKELTESSMKLVEQTNPGGDDETEESKEDTDKMLFFESEYHDTEPDSTADKTTKSEVLNVEPASDILLDLGYELPSDIPSSSCWNIDLLTSNTLEDCHGDSQTSVEDDWEAVFGGASKADDASSFLPSHLLDQLTTMQISKGEAAGSESQQKPAGHSVPESNRDKGAAGSKDQKTAWYSLFADLDPLTDPDAVGRSISNTHHSC